MKRILILSAPIGSGHKMTAQALVEELKNRNDIEIFEGDVFSFLPKWVGQSFLTCYLKLLQACPWLYGLAYSSSKSITAKNLAQEQKHLWLRNLLNGCLMKLGKEYLDSVKPDIVLATHATPLGIMSLYKEQHPELWLGAVVPDYNIHPWWLCDRVDAYFLADGKLKSRFPEDVSVEALGLPIRAAFGVASRTECRAKFGFKADEKVVLLMGGGEGLLPMEELVDTILGAQLPHTRLVVIAGKNEQLVHKLQKSCAGIKEEKLQIYGFREDAPELLTAADVLISKAGAVTAAEALACGLDYIIYRPLPGQETGNARFLATYHGAKIADNLQMVVQYLQNAKDTKIVPQKELQQASKRICDYILTSKS